LGGEAVLFFFGFGSPFFRRLLPFTWSFSGGSSFHRFSPLNEGPVLPVGFFVRGLVILSPGSHPAAHNRCPKRSRLFFCEAFHRPLFFLFPLSNFCLVALLLFLRRLMGTLSSGLCFADLVFPFSRDGEVSFLAVFFP